MSNDGIPPPKPQHSNTISVEAPFKVAFVLLDTAALLIRISSNSTSSSSRILPVIAMDKSTQSQPDRSAYGANDIVTEIWTALELPLSALSSISMPGLGPGLPSSFKIGHLAQASIGLTALASANIHAIRNNSRISQVTVPLRHACVEFKSERLYTINGTRGEDVSYPIGGLHETSDGYVRIHDGFPNHRDGALALLGLNRESTKREVDAAVKQWRAIDLESEAIKHKVVIAAIRTFEAWDILPQAHVLPNLPIQLRQSKFNSSCQPTRLVPGRTKCLSGLRVLELSRVLAAPIAGRTLAAHGADVLWVTSPKLPDLPHLDPDTSRGKRTIQLDLRISQDKAKFLELVKEADVFIQGFRPGSLAALGLSVENLHALNETLIIANLSAYGTEGPWGDHRGFDSIVQTCSGMNVSEAEHFGDGSPARSTPCQALDHASGYFLAAGIMAALHKRETVGGGYIVDVSLAGVMRYLRSLGQYEGESGFKSEDLDKNESVTDFVETKMSGFGELKAVKHSAQIEGMSVGWNIMPKPLGSDEAVWLE